MFIEIVKVLVRGDGPNTLTAVNIHGSILVVETTSDQCMSHIAMLVSPSAYNQLSSLII